MYRLKSIKLYFFSILKLFFLSIRNLYFKSSSYNKKLITFIPDRIIYSPSTYLSASLTTISNDFYKITNIAIPIRPFLPVADWQQLLTSLSTHGLFERQPQHLFSDGWLMLGRIKEVVHCCVISDVSTGLLACDVVFGL